jgi:hypothetical protein
MLDSRDFLQGGDSTGLDSVPLGSTRLCAASVSLSVHRHRSVRAQRPQRTKPHADSNLGRQNPGQSIVSKKPVCESDLEPVALGVL